MTKRVRRTLLDRKLSVFGRSVPLVAAVALAVLTATGVALWRVQADRPPPRPDRVTIEVGDAPQSIAAGALGLWVLEAGDGTVRRIDVAANEADAQVDVGESAGNIALGGDAVWIGYIEGRHVGWFDPTEARPRVRRVVAGRTPQAVAVGEGSVWVGALDAGTVARIDEVTKSRIGEPIELDDGFPSAIATGFGSVWVADVVADAVIRIDADTGEFEERIPVGSAPTAIATGEGGVWVANLNDSTLSHIDPSTNAPAGPAIILGAQPGGVAVGEGYVWVTRPDDDSVIRIDPETSEWTGEVFEVGDRPVAVATGAGSIWTTDQSGDTVTRLTFDE